MRGEHELCDRNANFQLPKFYVASNLNVSRAKQFSYCRLYFISALKQSDKKEEKERQDFKKALKQNKKITHFLGTKI